jgi:hypothetical protein
MNTSIKLGTIAKKSGVLSTLLITISIASGALLASTMAFADPVSQPTG